MNGSLLSISWRVARGEFIKLRQPRLLCGVLTTLTIFTAAMNYLSFHQRSDQPLMAGYELSLSFFGVLVICLCASLSAQDFSHGTLRNLYLRAPRRSGIMCGKFLAASFFIFTLNFYLVALSLICARLQGETFDLHSFPVIAREALTGFLGNCALGLIGSALGFIFASAVIAIGVGLLWSLVIESVLSASMPRAAPWLPIVNCINLAQSGQKSTAHLTLAHSASITVGYLALIITLGFFVFSRAEIS